MSIGDAVTSIFAGLVIFAILGFMASELSTTVDKVADEGKVFVFHRERVSFFTLELLRMTINLYQQYFCNVGCQWQRFLFLSFDK